LDQHSGVPFVSGNANNEQFRGAALNLHAEWQVTPSLNVSTSCRRHGKNVLSSFSQAVDDERAAFDESCAAMQSCRKDQSLALNRHYEADDGIYANLPPQTITDSALATRPA
jgi:hypothetical protein